MRTVVDLILLAVGGEDVLLELIGVDKHCSKREDTGTAEEKMLVGILKTFIQLWLLIVDWAKLEGGAFFCSHYGNQSNIRVAYACLDTN